MKNPSSRHRRGFSLIELLVVIAIIAVLAAAGFGAGNLAINNAKKTTAQAAAQGVVGAVNSFYTDNASMPVPSGGSSVDGGTKFQTDAVEGIKVLNILLGMEEEINTKKVRYLNAKEGKAKKDGIIYNQTGKEATGMYDPWGNPYIIVLDTNYEERIEVKPGNTEIQLNSRRCAVYSGGQDKKLGTKDDVKTW